MISGWIALLMLLGFSNTDKSAEVEKQLGDASQKVCEAFYAQYVKENSGTKKFGTEEKNVMINSCISRNLASSRNCAKTMISQVTDLQKRKSSAAELGLKMKNKLQPELQSCLATSNARSKKEMWELGKLYLSGKKDLVRAKVDQWSKSGK